MGGKRESSKKSRSVDPGADRAPRWDTQGFEGAGPEDLLRGLAAEPERQGRVLDEFLSTTGDQIYVLDRQGRYLYSNLAAALALGLDRSEIVGKTWRDLGLAPGVMQPFDLQREEVMATGQPVRRETRAPTSIGYVSRSICHSSSSRPPPIRIGIGPKWAGPEPICSGPRAASGALPSAAPYPFIYFHLVAC